MTSSLLVSSRAKLSGLADLDIRFLKKILLQLALGQASLYFGYFML